MSMSYRDISLKDLAQQYGIRNRQTPILTKVTELAPSEELNVSLASAKVLPLRSEKARSEWIVVPVLRELHLRNQDFLTIYSGEYLPADEQKGLTGECDFILARNAQTYDLSYPILSIVEAKKNDLDLGVAQCAAQLVGARLYNQQQGVDLHQVYGCVTTGKDWLFMRLSGPLIEINTEAQTLAELPRILGIFQHIIDQFREELRDVVLT